MAHLLPRRKPDWAWHSRSATGTVSSSLPARTSGHWLPSSNADGLADLHRTALDTEHQITRRSGRDDPTSTYPRCMPGCQNTEVRGSPEGVDCQRCEGKPSLMLVRALAAEIRMFCTSARVLRLGGLHRCGRQADVLVGLVPQGCELVRQRPLATVRGGWVFGEDHWPGRGLLHEGLQMSTPRSMRRAFQAAAMAACRSFAALY